MFEESDEQSEGEYYDWHVINVYLKIKSSFMFHLEVDAFCWKSLQKEILSFSAQKLNI